MEMTSGAVAVVLPPLKTTELETALQECKKCSGVISRDHNLPQKGEKYNSHGRAIAQILKKLLPLKR